ncbi:type II toxin-antitoxin system Phd/YefM family antitoxin [Ruficoccus amylovorans]|uniref:Antitoxin n=1 Tax=Ruficoccus amylovorans TaxID=1804625 RepID=A0A842HB55_9BACT|nr:type II toxin-antitoxin system prevent-host-death family antitoxin [Ruficoccus amylovorans]MBC2593510.1 type II toxin-antitoxin system Phd/YefM family antitoxin [Ruficoccus amylovorans]
MTNIAIMPAIHDIHTLHRSKSLPAAPASDLKNAFKSVYQKVLQSGPVTITRSRKPEAILLPVELYDQMIEELAARDPLEVFRKEYEARFAKMQSGKAQKAYEDAFNAPPDELGKAAIGSQPTR